MWVGGGWLTLGSGVTWEWARCRPGPLGVISALSPGGPLLALTPRTQSPSTELPKNPANFKNELQVAFE